MHAEPNVRASVYLPSDLDYPNDGTADVQSPNTSPARRAGAGTHDYQEAVRYAVAAIVPCEPLTADWLRVAQALVAVERAAAVEARRAGDEDLTMTLWERKEETVRLLVEEGKANLIVHLLSAAVALLVAPAKEQDAVFDAACAEHCWTSTVQAFDVVASFVATATSVLANASSSVEVIQVCDINLLLEALAREASIATNEGPGSDDSDGSVPRLFNASALRPLLDEANAASALKSARRTPVVQALTLVYCILQRCEEIGESRVLDMLADHAVLANAVAAIHVHAASLEGCDTAGCQYVLQLLAETLGTLMGTELYGGRSSKLVSKEMRDMLEALKGPILKAIEAGAPRVRSIVTGRTAVRGLRDAMRWF